MNLPFGLPAYKVTVGKQKDESATVHYERKLAEYRDILESYRRCILEYSRKLDGYDRRTKDNQLSIVQTALDLTYLKEQGDKTIEILENIKLDPINNSLNNLDAISTTLTDSSYKIDVLGRSLDNMMKSMNSLDSSLEGIDRNVVNRISELLLELQKQTVYQNKLLNTDMVNNIDKLSKSVKKGHVLLWFILIFNLFGLSAIAFIVMYYLEIIPFPF